MWNDRNIMGEEHIQCKERHYESGCGSEVHFCGRNEIGWGRSSKRGRNAKPATAGWLRWKLYICKTPVGFQEHVRAACIEIVLTFKEE